MTQTCTDHCRLCGQHFHGIGAYDLHRIGDIGLRDGPERRRCAAAAEVRGRRGEAALQAWTAAGVCALGPTPREEGVTIWQVVPSAQQVAFYAKGRSEQDADARSPENDEVGPGHVPWAPAAATVIPSSRRSQS